MKLLPSLLLLTIFMLSCQAELQTPEAFVEQFMSHLKDNNNEGLFSDCYISSKSEIKKFMQELTKSKQVDNNRIDEMYKASMEDKDRLCRKTSILINTDSSIQIDSISNSPQKIKGFGGDLEPSEGVRLSNITAFVNVDGNKYKILFQAVDLKTGQWKITKHPKVTEI